MIALMALTIIVAILLVFIGYTIGVAQNGIHIHRYTETNYQPPVKKDEAPAESSVNLNLNSQDYVAFAQQNNGRIDY